LVILWTRDKRDTRDFRAKKFRAHSDMVENKRERSLKERIKKGGGVGLGEV
jgi:hypothetical protein